MQRRTRLIRTGIMTTILILIFSLLLGACGDTDKEKAGSSNASQPASTSNTSPSGNGNTAGDLPDVTLTWYFPGNWPQAEQDKVFSEVNKVVKQKINATIDFKPISFGDYDQKMKVIIASGEPYDLAFTSNWINNYTQNVAKGAFLPLDDLLAQYAPKSYAAIPKNFWDATRVNGKIYGYINYQISARTPEVSTSKALAEKYGFDISSVGGKLSADTMNLLEPYIQAVKKDHPEKAFITALTQIQDMFTFETISGINIPGAVFYNDDSLKVVNQFETDEFKKFAAVMRDWNAKGYMNSKERISKKQDDWADGKAGKWIMDIGGAYKPGGDVLASSLGGEPYVNAPTSKAHLTTNGIIATMHAISRTSKNPERAMMLLELLNTDVELFNLLNFGIKDDHFKINNDGYMVAGSNQQAYNPQVPWMFASNFLAYIQEGMPKTVWEDTKKLNETAEPSKLLGFSFDAEPVKAEIGKTSAVFDEYYRGIELGVTSEEKYNEFLKKMNAAGADKILTEMQKQIDTWKAAQK
ncbi:ABC transporter substrate-binding protein [Paenibacillus sp. KQZ6P-2]|uniref:ABC transporter substrate-binding protein n=1 Tax=Paenibacillus mangrovi TaxID=2931978 RepID=A0A9X2B3D6_9BACL|nr:ABC transporter substrate-binding protein [Paenibacillus mangrovi]MCJ8010442.1 ABC transporter substrate-binding protein [Paenibacillus mangrovi]